MEPLGVNIFSYLSLLIKKMKSVHNSKVKMCVGNWAGAVARALSSHQCGQVQFPDSASYVICGLSLLVLFSALLHREVVLASLWFSPFPDCEMEANAGKLICI